MQLRLPLFPVDTRLISSCLGVYQKDMLVQYIANGLPVYSHGVDDLQSFRFITSNFIKEGLCKSTEVARCFCIPIDTVKRSLKKLREQGEVAFFSEENRQGHCHKIVGGRAVRIQKMLDLGLSNSAAAKSEGISEGSVRYAIKQGYLKKTVVRHLPHLLAAPTTSGTVKT